MNKRERTKGRISPNKAELTSIYGELFKKLNVQCCYIGKKTKNNVKSEEIAIVCGVKSKIRKKDLPPSDRIPPYIPWLKNSSRPRRIKTDVIEFSGRFELQAGPILGPGDKITRLQTNLSATIGIALHHPDYGPVITTAGHLFKDPVLNEEVVVFSGNTSVKGFYKKRVFDNRADYALIKIEEPYPVDNLFKDMYPIGPLFIPSENNLNEDLLILTTKDTLEVKCEGIHGQFSDEAATMTDLIFTTWRTVGGDSGSCLIGKENRIWGILVGCANVRPKPLSAFLPAYIPLTLEKADLI